MAKQHCNPWNIPLGYIQKCNSDGTYDVLIDAPEPLSSTVTGVSTSSYWEDNKYGWVYVTSNMYNDASKGELVGIVNNTPPTFVPTVSKRQKRLLPTRLLDIGELDDTRQFEPDPKSRKILP